MKTGSSAILIAILIALAPVTLSAQDLHASVVHWEQRLNARIGVVLRDADSDWEISLRGNERFPMSSTFKVLLCGAVLARVDAGEERLDRRVTYDKDDLVAYSPVTARQVEGGLTVGELCEATVTLSDNSAANLLLRSVGGPTGLTRFLHGIGDETTRLDRWETDLNEAVPGDARDTSTPSAMLNALQMLLLGDVLQPESAAQLRQWMIDVQVADELLRLHLPQGWVIGDKTGAGGHGSRAIVAFLEPAANVNYFAAIYLTESKADLPLRNQALSEIGAAMISSIEARRAQALSD